MNLAKWKYSQVHSEHGGPISRVSVREIDLFGVPSFEAYAYLDEAQAPYIGDSKKIYGAAHGTGTSQSRSDALHKAISEALERWAWSHCLNKYRADRIHKELRFDLVSSTDGFAAFPGFFARSPREAAFSEALERWAVCSWWEGKLGHRISIEAENEICSIEIDQPFCTHSVAISWRDRPFGRVYGFACAENFTFACQKAMVELDRNARVLKEYFSSATKDAPINNVNEKRILFFAGEKGITKFERRLSTQISNRPNPPELVVDKPVIGPWTKYVHVWRCLFHQTDLDSSRHDQNTLDYFCF